MKISRPVAIAAALGAGIIMDCSPRPSQIIKVPEPECSLEINVLNGTPKTRIETVLSNVPTKSSCIEFTNRERQSILNKSCDPKTYMEGERGQTTEIRGRLLEGGSLQTPAYFQVPGSKERQFVNNRIIQCPKKN